MPGILLAEPMGWAAPEKRPMPQLAGQAGGTVGTGRDGDAKGPRHWEEETHWAAIPQSLRAAPRRMLTDRATEAGVPSSQLV